MRRGPVPILVIFAAGIAVACGVYLCGYKPEAQFVMQAVLALCIVMAATVALFRDQLQQSLDPLRLRIEVPPIQNSHFERTVHHDAEHACYTHHLLVVNDTPHRKAEGCQVWLAQIYTMEQNGQWEPTVRFAVPRLMLWAPAEYSGDKRSFSDRQVFNLGRHIGNNQGFVIDAWEGQSGTFTREYAAGSRLCLVFEVTAENYTQRGRFYVEVQSPMLSGSSNWVPAVVQLIKAPDIAKAKRKVPAKAAS